MAKKQENVKENKSNLYRSAAEGLHARKKNALLAPQSWFLGKKKESKKSKSRGRLLLEHGIESNRK